MKIKNLIFSKIPIGYVVMFLRSFAFILIIITTSLIFIDWGKNTTLIASLGILISALLASYSMILNIDTTVNLKNREISNQVRNTFFQLCLLKMRLISLNNEKSRERMTFADVDRIFDSFDDIYEILKELQSENIVSISHNDMLTDIHMLFLQLSTFKTHLKVIRRNLRRPEPQNDNTAKYPNPLNSVDFKIDEMIERLTNILTYLRDGYNKDFQKDGKGIGIQLKNLRILFLQKVERQLLK